MIRASVTELPDNRDRFELAWALLVQHVDFAESDIVVLPELPVLWGLPPLTGSHPTIGG